MLRKFSKCCRYIDDLLTINNDNFMEKWKSKIYPPELILTSDDKCDQKVNFLDLHLEIKNHQLFYRIFDKRDSFNFPIINFPCLSGNIPTLQSYNTFTSQLIRYGRGCQCVEDFHYRTKILVLKLLKQFFTLTQLQITYNKFLNNYFQIIRKYGTNIKRKLSDVIS